FFLGSARHLPALSILRLRRYNPAKPHRRSPQMSYAELEALGRKLESIDHAIAILSADEATNMPVGGGEKRAVSVSYLHGLRHETATAPQIADWIASAETEDLSDDEKLGLREFTRVYTNATC